MTMSDVTGILETIEGGDTRTVDQLLPLVYEELRTPAARKLSHEVIVGTYAPQYPIFDGETFYVTLYMSREQYRIRKGQAHSRCHSLSYYLSAPLCALRSIQILIAFAKRAERWV